MCVWVHVRIGMCVHVYACMCVSAKVWVYECMRVSVFGSMGVWVCGCMGTYVDVCMCACVHGSLATEGMVYHLILESKSLSVPVLVNQIHVVPSRGLWICAMVIIADIAASAPHAHLHISAYPTHTHTHIYNIYICICPTPQSPNILRVYAPFTQGPAQSALT